MIVIPTRSDGKLYGYTEVVRLDGVPYLFRFLWSIRCDHWTLGIYAADETPVAEGILIVNAVDLLRGCTSANKPGGTLFALPSDTSEAHAGFTDLGTRVKLYYIEAGT